MVDKWFFNYFALKEAQAIHIGKPPPAAPIAMCFQRTDPAKWAGLILN